MPKIQANVIKLLNWLLYSNVFIACCALGMTLQTMFLRNQEPIINRAQLSLRPILLSCPALLGLVFFATWFIYALHRLVSWQKLDANLDIPRFQIIGYYQSHLKVYTFLSGLLAMGCFFYLKWNTQLALLLPACLSLGYVLPFIGQRQLRLRDLHFVKIFLIAVVWSYVTVVLPWVELSEVEAENATSLIENYRLLLGQFVERCLFIFIITLPFDLRDWKLDAHHSVKTIPAVLGPQRTIQLGLILLLCWAILVTWLYPWPLPIAYYATALWTGGLLWRTLCPVGECIQVVQQDYYYTGLIDGTILVQVILVLGLVLYL